VSEAPPLSNETVRISAVGQILRRRWRQLAVVAALGAALGAGASLLVSPGYQTSTTVLLHIEGSNTNDQLATETQVATTSTVLDRAAAALGWGVTGSDLQGSVHANVAEGNLINVTATADTPERAQQLADRVAEEYVKFTAQLGSITADAAFQASLDAQEALRRQLVETNLRITELHGAASRGLTVEAVEMGTRLEQLRTDIAKAMAKLDEAAALPSRSKAVILGSAELPSSKAPPTMAQLVAGGAVLFFLLGVLGHLAAARADRRLRDDSEIAAALGSSILGSIDVPGDPIAGESPNPTRLRSRLMRLVRDDLPWDVPEQTVSRDDLSRNIRYRRVLAKLRNRPGAPLRVTVVLAHDDATARRAVAQLAIAADAEGGPALVITDRRDFSSIVRATAESIGLSTPSLTIRSSADVDRGTYVTVLHVVDLSVDRPTVPEIPPSSGVLLVVTAGTRTAWELVGIAEACADAGHRILGTVITHRARPIGRRRNERKQQSLPKVSIERNAMAGSP
jgi:capsular polysaccharide biosynthesis protein